MNQQLDMLNDSIPQLLRRLAVPTSIGFFFNTMFNVVDTIYGGMISTQALAAMALSFPLFFLIISVGAGISTGASAIIGHLLGAGNHGEARLYSAQAIAFGAAHGVLVSLAGWAMAPALFRILGARDVYLEMALSYMNAIFSGSLFFLLNFVFNSLLVAAGDTRSFRNFLVGGFFLNALLDPWFLFGGLGLPAMGLAGIAWATVTVQICGCCYLVIRVSRTGLLRCFTWRDLRPRYQPFRELARQGFPASLNMLTVGIGIIIITWVVSHFGKDAVAAYGIGSRIEQIALLPVMGLNSATLVLVAQNSGAGQPGRVRETIVTALKSGVVLMSCGTALLLFSSGLLMKLFSQDQAVIRIGVSFLQVEALVLNAYVILYLCVAALQGLKMPAFALWIGMFRQIAAPIPLFYLLAVICDFGIKGIWWGIFLVTWTAAFIALFFMRRTMRLILAEW